MQITLPCLLLARLSELIAAHTGLLFPKERWGDLERGVTLAGREVGMHDAGCYASWLVSTPWTSQIITLLACHLTVGETYFFRQKECFEALELYILPELLRMGQVRNRCLRIWSAGCCTGEEPYSIAILLDRVMRGQPGWEASILATDINPRFLRKAGEGVYSEWSFRGAPDWIRERYFKKISGGRFEVRADIKKTLTFSSLNLVEDAYPWFSNNSPGMDVIFCRNVLMYFSVSQANKVIENLYRSLNAGGWLIVSPTETPAALFRSFSRVELTGVTLYQKAAGAESRAGVIGRPTPMSVSEPDEAFRLGAWVATPGPTESQTGILTESGVAPLALIRPVVGSDLAASAQPNDPESLRLKARTYADRGRLSDAIEWCQKAIATDKLNPAHHYLLASVLQERGEVDAAAQSLKHAIYLDWDFVLAHFALGNLRLSQGRHNETRRHFANALSLLRKQPQSQILPESEGLTAGRLFEIITSAQSCLWGAAVINT